MARLKKKSNDTVSLFPFLSILVCLIGTLTLIIFGMTVASLGKESSDEVIKRADDYDRMKAKLTHAEAALAARSSNIAAHQKLLADIAAERKAQEQIQLSLAARKDELAKLNELQKTLTLVAAATGKETEKVKTLELKRDETRKAIAKLNRPPDAPKVLVLPAERGGGGSMFRPKFVEITSKGIILRDRDKPLTIPTAKVKTDPVFKELLDVVGGSEDLQIVYLLRDNAYGVFNLARDHATNNDARFGVLPVRGDGPLDLSGFKNL